MTVHDLSERNTNDEGVGERREREASDGPTITTLGSTLGPKGQDENDNKFSDGVGGDEREVEMKRVDMGSEVEGEERESEIAN